MNKQIKIAKKFHEDVYNLLIFNNNYNQKLQIVLFNNFNSNIDKLYTIPPQYKKLMRQFLEISKNKNCLYRFLLKPFIEIKLILSNKQVRDVFRSKETNVFNEEKKTFIDL